MATREVLLEAIDFAVERPTGIRITLGEDGASVWASLFDSQARAGIRVVCAFRTEELEMRDADLGSLFQCFIDDINGAVLALCSHPERYAL